MLQETSCQPLLEKKQRPQGRTRNQTKKCHIGLCELVGFLRAISVGRAISGDISVSVSIVSVSVVCIR